MLKRNTDLFIKLLLIIILTVLLMVILRAANTLPQEQVIKVKAVEVNQPVLKDKPVLYSDIAYSVYYDQEPTEEYLIKVRSSINELESLDANDFTGKAVKAMCKELSRLKEIEAKMSSDLAKYSKWEKEHYYAAKVWEYLRQRNFSQEVACGIIGNMMIETSGSSLDLRPNIYSPSGNYYGLCQWSQKYYPGTKDLPFEYQLDYLLGTMPQEFNTFGRLYKKDFTYEDFIKIKDPAEAALVFAKVYERCGSASYELRKQAAEKAYNYFDF